MTMESKLKYLPLGLLFALFVKSMNHGLNWEAVSLSLIFSALWYVLEYKQQDKQIKELEEKMKELELSHKERDVIISDLKSSVSSLRVSNGLKPQQFKING